MKSLILDSLNPNIYLCIVKTKNTHIQDLISEGEHVMLDFKFEISDSRRIARSLCAFANTKGGRLLVGVKDNGAIAGVRSDEEQYMIQAAAEMYCQPPVEYETREWEINGKTVLEVVIPQDSKVKHKAPDNQGDYKIYIRVADENILADPILLKLWKRQRNGIPIKLSFTDKEQMLLNYLTDNKDITLDEYVEMSGLKRKKAENIIIDFLLAGTICMKTTNSGVFFSLSEE